jgi:hypothetical protein
MPPVDPADLTDSQPAVAGIGPSNVISTLVRHPDELTAWLGLGTPHPTPLTIRPATATSCGARSPPSRARSRLTVIGPNWAMKKGEPLGR